MPASIVDCRMPSMAKLASIDAAGSPKAGEYIRAAITVQRSIVLLPLVVALIFCGSCRTG